MSARTFFYTIRGEIDPACPGHLKQVELYDLLGVHGVLLASAENAAILFGPTGREEWSKGEAQLQQVLDPDDADAVLGDFEELFQRDLMMMARKDAERLRENNVRSVERTLPGYRWRSARRQLFRGIKHGIWIQIIWSVLLSSAS